LNTGIEKYNYVTHIVQAGDYLLMLAAKYHSTVEAIVQANGLKDPNLIIDGEELIIPIIP
jgi:putative chitinase